MRRLVSVSLPFWETERLTRRSPPPSGARPGEAPLATVAAVAGGQRLQALNPAARTAGLASGMMLAAARALVPDLVLAPDEPEASRADLEALARWACRWTPFAAPAPGTGPGEAALMLDISGCAHLFGGEAAMLADIGRRIRTLGLTARVASARTPGAAFALARFAAGDGAGNGAGLVVADARLEAMVGRLPVEGLRITAADAQGLRALGLKTIGQVAALAPDALARRFGAGLPRRLDQALGRQDEAISPVGPVLERRARVRLAEPLLTVEGLQIGLGRAVSEVAAVLEQAGEGARQMQIGFWRVDGAVFSIEAGAGRAHADVAVWTRLLTEKLSQAGERLDLGFGVDLVEAAVPVAERRVAEVIDLDPAAAAAIASADAMHRLADRLSARLGTGRVSRIEIAPVWAPERVQTLRPALASPGRAAPEPASHPASQPHRPRPALLMDAPEPVETLAEVPDGPPRMVRWRGQALKVARAEGPERLAGTPGGLRDYYRVETSEGRRLWLFRRGLQETPDAPAPQWFVHALG